MKTNLLSLLPDLVLFEDSRGNWNAYIEKIYTHFQIDFVENRTLFQSAPVFVRYHPAYDNKGATFWHLISEGALEADRIPDLRRCERICWPRSLIENELELDIKIWESFRPWKGQEQRRYNISLSDFSYLVVLAENSTRLDLVTAYPIERQSTKIKLEREFESYTSQKKEGSAV